MSNKNKIINNLYHMTKIRIVEEEIAKEYQRQEMRCPVHLSIGQEAIPVGISSSLSKKDYIISTHRCHAHYLAKGGSLDSLIGELYGKINGTCKGIGGSMHMYDKKVNHLGSIPIVGGSIPIGVGIAYSLKLNNENKVSVIYFGDAATEEGVFFESIHFASLKNLPVIFVCEDNNYSVYTAKLERQGKRDLKKIVKSMGVKYIETSDNDVNDIQAKAIIARKYAISSGPVFIYSKTYRYFEHCGPNNDDNLKYRPQKEIKYWIEKDPIKMEIRKLIKSKKFNKNKYEKFCDKTKQEIAHLIIKTKKMPILSLKKLQELEYA